MPLGRERRIRRRTRRRTRRRLGCAGGPLAMIGVSAVVGAIALAAVAGRRR